MSNGANIKLKRAEYEARTNPNSKLPWTSHFYLKQHLSGQVTVRSKLWKITSSIMLTALNIASQALLLHQTVRVHNIETYKAVVQNRKSKPLITYSNHLAVLDDALIIGALNGAASSSLMVNQAHMRWTLGAQELCFKDAVVSWICTYGKVLPIVRGNGIWQAEMEPALQQLSSPDGDNWLHIYPEGRINQSDTPLRFKWGIGRLITDCDETPIVLPIYCKGTDQVFPDDRRIRWMPSFGANIKIIVGNPIDLSDLVAKAKLEAEQLTKAGLKVDRVNTYEQITSILQTAMEELSKSPLLKEKTM